MSYLVDEEIDFLACRIVQETGKKSYGGPKKNSDIVVLQIKICFYLI